MKNKVLVIVLVPMIGEKYEVFIPVNKTVKSIVGLLVKTINELSNECYPLKKDAVLYSKATGADYKFNIIIKDTDIRNGSEVILI